MFEWINKLRKNRLFISTSGMIIGTIIYCFALVFVLDFGRFYAGGVTGIAQIFANIFSQPYLKSVLIGVVNVPLFVIGWRSVSKRFAILSAISIVLQVILTAFFDFVKANGFNPFNTMAVFDGVGTLTNTLVFALLGGAMTGLGCAITLRAGASTGGMDIVSQRVSLHSNIPFANISGSIDVAIICAGAIIAQDISVAVYTIIRLVIHVIVLDKVYTIYKYQKIQIITKKKEEMQVALLKNFAHGLTIYQAIGGYTEEVKWSIETIVLTYEVEEYQKMIKEVDPHAFLCFNSVKGIHGNFNKKVIS